MTYLSYWRRHRAVATAVVVLSVAAVIAGYVPARRAAGRDPLETLPSE